MNDNDDVDLFEPAPKKPSPAAPLGGERSFENETNVFSIEFGKSGISKITGTPPGPFAQAKVTAPPPSFEPPAPPPSFEPSFEPAAPPAPKPSPFDLDDMDLDDDFPVKKEGFFARLFKKKEFDPDLDDAGGFDDDDDFDVPVKKRKGKKGFDDFDDDDDFDLPAKKSKGFDDDDFDIGLDVSVPKKVEVASAAVAAAAAVSVDDDEDVFDLGAAVSKSAVSTPAVSTPSVPTPAASTPSVPPSVPTPAVSTPAVSTPSVPTPSVPIPSASTPSVPTSSVPTPSVPTPTASKPAPKTTLSSAALDELDTFDLGSILSSSSAPSTPTSSPSSQPISTPSSQPVPTPSAQTQPQPQTQTAPPVFTRIAHVCLFVKDLDASIRYYSALGMRRRFVFNKKGRIYGAYMEFGAGGNFIELFEDPARAGAPNGRLAHFCLETPDISAAISSLTASGISFTPKKFGCDATYQIWLKDPDGNDFEIHQYTPKSSQVIGGDVEVDW